MNLTEYKQRLADSFSRSSKNYGQGNTLHPRLAHRLVELAQLQQGQNVLDIATGTGLVAIAASQIVGAEGKVIGIDISTGMLEVAQQNIEALGLPNVELKEADAEQLDLLDDSFDAILCSSSMVWLTNIKAALESWYRFLKPGGLVGFSCFANTAFPLSILFRQVALRYGITVPDVNEPLNSLEKCHKMLKDIGFQDIEIKVDQFGDYVSDGLKSWQGNSNRFFDLQAPSLSLEQMEQFKAEYLAEAQALATEQGIWDDSTTFFVIGRK